MVERVVKKKTFRKGNIVQPSPGVYSPGSVVYGIIEIDNGFFFEVRWYLKTGVYFRSAMLAHEIHHLDPGMLTDDERRELAKNVL